ncbi:MAG: alpha/beta hydrolase [Paracoccaceae bacterium]|nr:alpha/beta hydrolase [Paracoccaceae bacterium]MDG2451228.1 alpha/beta hydrolase [Paracoccaceae bacterium]
MTTIPTVFVHPALAHAGIWRGVCAYMALAERPVLVDLLGHGRAGDWDGQADYSDVALAALLAVLPDEPCHLIGHSLGGALSLRLALEHPDRIARLSLIEPVLFAAAAGTQAHRDHLTFFAPFQEAFEAGDRETPTRQFTAHWGSGENWDKLPAPQRAYLTDRIHIIPATGAFLEQDRSQLLGAGRLEALAIPTTLIRGSASPAIVGAIHCELLGRSSMTELLIDGAAHMMSVTHPAELAAALA